MGGTGRGPGPAAYFRDGAPGRVLHPGRRAARPLPARGHLADTHTGTAAGPPALPAQGSRCDPDDHGRRTRAPGGPHLDALVEIAESGVDEESAVRTLHLAGPPEFISLRALPALTPSSPTASPCAARSSRTPRRRWKGSPPDTMIWPSQPPGRAVGCSPRLRSATRSMCWSLPRAGPHASAPERCGTKDLWCWSSCRWWKCTRACRSSPATGPLSSTAVPRPRAPS